MCALESVPENTFRIPSTVRVVVSAAFSGFLARPTHTLPETEETTSGTSSPLEVQETLCVTMPSAFTVPACLTLGAGF